MTRDQINTLVQKKHLLLESYNDIKADQGNLHNTWKHIGIMSELLYELVEVVDDLTYEVLDED